MEIIFENFIIRPVQIDDATHYYSFIERNRDRLLDYFPKTIIATKNIKLTTDFISERQRLFNLKEFFTYIIVNNDTKEIIGTIFIKNIDWNIPKGELGFFVHKDYAGKGIITKSLSLIIKYCFQNLKMNKLFMRIAKENTSSKRVAEKNGFILEGILRNDFKISDGSLIDVLYYGLLNQNN